MEGYEFVPLACFSQWRKLVSLFSLAGLILHVTSIWAKPNGLKVYGFPKTLESEISRCFSDLSPVQKEAFFQEELKRSQFIQDVKLFLQASGYYASDLYFRRSDETGDWELHALLGPPTKLCSIDFEVIGEPVQANNLKLLLQEQLPPLGSILSHQAFNQFVESVEATAKAYGYFDGDWEVRRIELFPSIRMARWSLRFNSGRRYQFGSIVVDQSIVDPRAIKGLCPFQEGDFYQESLVTAYILSLYETQWFEVITFNKQPDRDRALLPIELHVKPGFNHSINCGLGIAHQEGLRLRFQYTCFRLNQLGHSLLLVLNSQKRSLLSTHLAYRIPCLSQVNQAYYMLRYSLARQAYGTFPRQFFEQGFYAERHGQRAAYWFWNLGMHIFYENFWVPGYRATWLNHLFGYARYMRRWRAEPIRSLDGGLSLDGCPFVVGGTFPLLRLRAHLQMSIHIAQQSECDLRFSYQTMMVSKEDWYRVPPGLRFYMGGRDTVRGYPLQSLGPVTYSEADKKSYTTGGSRACMAGVEHHLKFSDRWRFSQFIDAGSLSHRNPKARWYIGFGAGIGYTFELADLSIEAALPGSEAIPLSWSRLQWDFRLGKRL